MVPNVRCIEIPAAGAQRLVAVDRHLLAACSAGPASRPAMLRMISVSGDLETIWEKIVPPAQSELYLGADAKSLFLAIDGSLHKLEPATGDELQSTSSFGEAWGVRVASGRVWMLVNNPSPRLLSFDADDLAAAPAEFAFPVGEVLVAACSGLVGVQLSPRDGHAGRVRVLRPEADQQWSAEDTQILCDITRHNESLIVHTDSSEHGRVVTNLDPDSLQERWSVPLGMRVNRPVSECTGTIGIVDDVCVVASQKNELVGIEVTSGNVRWRNKDAVDVHHALQVAGSRLWHITPTQIQEIDAAGRVGASIALPDVVELDSDTPPSTHDFNMFTRGGGTAAVGRILAVGMLRRVALISVDSR